MKAGLLAAASAVCALGTILCFIAALLCIPFSAGTSTDLFLWTFVLGLAAAFFDRVAILFVYGRDEGVLGDNSETEPAKVVALRRVEAVLRRRQEAQRARQRVKPITTEGVGDSGAFGIAHKSD
jgi:hypothetical protein